MGWALTSRSVWVIRKRVGIWRRKVKMRSRMGQSREGEYFHVTQIQASGRPFRRNPEEISRERISKDPADQAEHF